MAATVPAGFSEALIASGLTSPTAMQLAPDGRIFVCEKDGRLRVIKQGALLPAPFATVAVDAEAERGLLGVAVDPNFTVTPYVYVYYTVPAGGGVAAHNRVSRFTAAGDVAVPGSEVVLLELDALTTTLHNAGALDFGTDGKLYVAVGDNAVGGNAQSLSTRLGKLLRVNPDGSIPSDNPFYLSAAGPNRAIWAYGLRNPFKFAVNPSGLVPALAINDVGGSQFEEVNDGAAGANYGYPGTEGYTSHPGYTSPRFAYDHGPNGGCAITGGAFYAPGSAGYPADFANTYLFADLCAGFIRRLDLATNTVTAFAAGIASPVDVRVHDGFVYYLSMDDGAVYRIEFGTSQPRITAHPRDRIVSPGQAVTFTVSASGATPLSYRWRRNGADIAGATGPSYTLASPQLADTGARFGVVVSNAAGTVESQEARLTVTLNQPPTATILLPAAGSSYRGGMTVAFAGAGVDPEDGVLAPAALTWRVDFHHHTHVHPFLPPTSGLTSGTFVIPTTGETAANVWYRLILTVTDRIGWTHTVERDIFPQLVRVTLATSPPGLQVRLDGRLESTPYAFDGVVGVARIIEAPDQQVGAVQYVYTAWSDGGAAARVIATPTTETTYVAWFRTVAAADAPAAPQLTVAANGATLRGSWERMPGAMSYRLEVGTVPGLANVLDVDVGDVDHVEGVAPPGVYFLRVRAVNSHGVSPPSAEVSVTTGNATACVTAPPPPAGYTAQTGGLTAAFAWTSSLAATSYLLEVGSSPGLANLLVAGVGNGTTFQATAPAGAYYTRLRAVNACGSSSPSVEVPVVLGCSAEAVVPGGLSVAKAGGAATFSWLPPLGATGYRLRVRAAPGASDLADFAVGDTSATTVSLAGVTPGTYYVRVVAVSACGVGSPSNEVAVSVP